MLSASNSDYEHDVDNLNVDVTDMSKWRTLKWRSGALGDADLAFVNHELPEKGNVVWIHHPTFYEWLWPGIICEVIQKDQKYQVRVRYLGVYNFVRSFRETSMHAFHMLRVEIEIAELQVFL